MKSITYKLLLSLFLGLFCLMANGELQAQETVAKFDTLSFSTSAVCGMCKKTIEGNVGLEKGVKNVSLDLETKVVTVVYKLAKNDEASIKEAIVKLGYSAGELSADEKAKAKLHSCCRSPH